MKLPWESEEIDDNENINLFNPDILVNRFNLFIRLTRELDIPDISDRRYHYVTQACDLVLKSIAIPLEEDIRHGSEILH